MNKVYRVFVEKRKDYAVEAHSLLTDLQNQLGLCNLKDVKIVNRYDIQNISQEVLDMGIDSILSEPMVDDVYLEDYPNMGNFAFAIEYLPGQYDQRADACEQCFQLLTSEIGVKVRCARLIVLAGELSDNDVMAVQKFMVNPVDQRITTLDKYDNLNDVVSEIKPVSIVEGFIDFSDDQLRSYVVDNGMAMNFDDLKLTQQYFKDEGRNPTITEIKVLDTYWSDHCRHTTFSTIIDDIKISDGEFSDVLRSDLENYKTSRHLVYGVDTKRPITLMDLATISMKQLRKEGYLNDLEVSEEINACSIEITVNTDQGSEDWLLMFKNETHNHPTEIEPFGGAATCLGGAIRDPLSGRAYVYQSMRITGAGDPRQALEDTMEGKLAQRKICQEAAHGFSSYGNQIGLTTGYVREIYDDGYVAKRMELGAVVA
ncbi:MAG: phosphoribosylformylglycinamidine synthase, partial [Erysipelotrichaceae bacterium]